MRCLSLGNGEWVRAELMQELIQVNTKDFKSRRFPIAFKSKKVGESMNELTFLNVHFNQYLQHHKYTAG